MPINKKPLPQTPFQAKLIEQSDYLAEPWAKWIRDLVQKINELEARIKALEPL